MLFGNYYPNIFPVRTNPIIMSPAALDPEAHCILHNTVHTAIRCDNDNLPFDELDDENGNILGVASEPKRKIGAVSIDVTKALILLGFTSWSELEDGTEI
jgi:hypothetical protein